MEDEYQEAIRVGSKGSPAFDPLGGRTRKGMERLKARENWKGRTFVAVEIRT